MDTIDQSHGYLYPWPNGWYYAPAGLEGVDGLQEMASDTSPTGSEWFVIKGSPAWEMLMNPTRREGSAPFRAAGGRGGSISLMPGSISGTTPISVGSSDAPSGQGEPVSEYTNDPALGVVPIGVPTDQSMVARAWTAPRRLVSRLLPVGPVSGLVGQSLEMLPWAVWGLIGWWIWRRIRR